MAIETETYWSKGINWTWYLRLVRQGKGKCRITLHDRLHDVYHINHPRRKRGTFRLVEKGTERTLIAVEVTSRINPKRTERLNVINPGYVFNYPKFTEKNGG